MTLGTNPPESRRDQRLLSLVYNYIIYRNRISVVR